MSPPRLPGGVIKPPVVQSTTTEKPHLLTRRRAIAAGLVVAVVAAGVTAFGVTRKTSAVTTEQTPAVPGNTVSAPATSAAPSETTIPSATPSAESTAYVRKNNLPQVSTDAVFEQWRAPRAAKIATLIAAAKSPEEAIAVVKAADPDDVESYVVSWVNGSEGTKTNDFIDMVYTQNPNAFPKALLEDLPKVGGKELLNYPRLVLDGINLVNITVSRIAQDPTKTDATKLKEIAALEASIYAPIIDVYTETRAVTTPDLSTSYYLDDVNAAKALMAKTTGPLGLVSLMVNDPTVQATIMNPKVKAKILTATGQVYPATIIAVAGEVYNDTAGKKPVIWSIADDTSNTYTFPQLVQSTDARNLSSKSFPMWLSEAKRCCDSTKSAQYVITEIVPIN
jgi:hypothetical protein